MMTAPSFDDPEKSPEHRQAMQRVQEYLALEELLYGDTVQITEAARVCVYTAALVRQSGLVCAVCGADPTAPEAEPAAWGIALEDPALDPDGGLLGEWAGAIICPLHDDE